VVFFVSIFLIQSSNKKDQTVLFFSSVSVGILLFLQLCLRHCNRRLRRLLSATDVDSVPHTRPCAKFAWIALPHGSSLPHCTAVGAPVAAAAVRKEMGEAIICTGPAAHPTMLTLRTNLALRLGANAVNLRLMDRIKGNNREDSGFNCWRR